MALIGKDIRGTLIGVGIGAGAVLLVRYIAPVVGAVARPLAKALISSSMAGFEKAAGVLAGGAEAFQDLVAEARAERKAPAEVATATAVSEAPRGMN